MFRTGDVLMKREIIVCTVCNSGWAANLELDYYLQDKPLIFIQKVLKFHAEVFI